MAVYLKNRAALEKMRQAGRIVAEVLAETARRAAPGVTTGQLDALAEEIIRRRGGVPAFKGYLGYPATICASINEELVHGIPGARVLREGDILTVDVGVRYGGYHADAAVTVPIGAVSPELERLLAVTREALERGLAQVRPGNRVGDISWAIQSFVEGQGFGIVREYVGHGIGRKLHEEPQVPNFGRPGTGPRLRPGMTLAVEPMVCIGEPEVRVLEDRWTVVTVHGPSAHFEHTVAVTEDGVEILTQL